MRVRKNDDGTFVVEDEPLHVVGQDAARLLADMEKRDQAPPDPERERFLAECDRVYSKARGSE